MSCNPVSSEDTFRFPAEEDIILYLQEYSTTKGYLTEKKVIHAIAKVFANQEKTINGINMGVTLTLQDLSKSKKLQLSKIGFTIIHINLTAALKDCAKEATAYPRTFSY